VHHWCPAPRAPLQRGEDSGGHASWPHGLSATRRVRFGLVSAAMLPATAPSTVGTVPTGYGHASYARSLCEFGDPLHLTSSDSWVLRREVPGGGAYDVTGCYPLLACADWSQLAGDLLRLTPGVVSFVGVSEPFAEIEPIRTEFDLFKPFKEHYVVDVADAAWASAVTKHHRYYARLARRAVKVELEGRPLDLLDTWDQLYAGLAARHDIRGIRRFSRRAFRGQLETPGLTLFTARLGSEVVGAHLWYVQGEVAYSHLTAFSDAGYLANAGYALYEAALHHFAEAGLRFADIGSGAGLTDDATSGLRRFKCGWTRATRPVYLIGKVLDAERYGALVAASTAAAGEYFPAYRTGLAGP
jgi:hypothetical protein